MDQSCSVGVCSQAHKLCMYINKGISYNVFTMCSQVQFRKWIEVFLASVEAQDYLEAT